MMKHLLTYGVILILFSVVLFFLFQIGLFKDERILFFRGLKLIFITIIFLGISLIFVKKKFLVSGEILFGAMSMAVAFHITCLIVFPVTFERSLTMYLLSVASKQEYLKRDGFENLLVNGYIKKDGAVEKRLKEQEQIGFLKEESDGFILTDQGKNFLFFSSFIGKIYGLEK